MANLKAVSVEYDAKDTLQRLEVARQLALIRGREIGDLEDELAETNVELNQLSGTLNRERKEFEEKAEALERKVMKLRVELNDVADALASKDRSRKPSKRCLEIAARIKDVLFRPEASR